MKIRRVCFRIVIGIVIVIEIIFNINVFVIVVRRTNNEGGAVAFSTIKSLK